MTRRTVAALAFAVVGRRDEFRLVRATCVPWRLIRTDERRLVTAHEGGDPAPRYRAVLS